MGLLIMKHLVWLFFIFLYSCKSVTYDDVNPHLAQNTILLPPLETVTDIYNLESTYSAGGFNAIAGNIGGQSFSDNLGGWMQTTDISGVNYKDVRVSDVINIFQKEVLENITNPYGPKQGYIVLKLGYIQDDSSIFYPLISLCSLYTLNLLGVPQNKITQTLEVEVSILDTDKNLIKRYVQIVNNTDYIAMWWGYDDNDVYRKLAAANIKQALADIRSQIGQDALQIRSQLQQTN